MWNRKAKIHLESKLASNMQGNKKFYSYSSSKRKTRKNVGLLLHGPHGKGDGNGHLLNMFFALVFTSQTNIQKSQAPETG